MQEDFQLYIFKSDNQFSFHMSNIWLKCCLYLETAFWVHAVLVVGPLEAGSAHFSIPLSQSGEAFFLLQFCSKLTPNVSISARLQTWLSLKCFFLLYVFILSAAKFLLLSGKYKLGLITVSKTKIQFKSVESGSSGCCSCRGRHNLVTMIIIFITFIIFTIFIIIIIWSAGLSWVQGSSFAAWREPTQKISPAAFIIIIITIIIITSFTAPMCQETG